MSSDATGGRLWRDLWEIVRGDLLLQLRDPLAILFMVLMPLGVFPALFWGVGEAQEAQEAQEARAATGLYARPPSHTHAHTHTHKIATPRCGRISVANDRSGSLLTGRGNFRRCQGGPHETEASPREQWGTQVAPGAHKIVAFSGSANPVFLSNAPKIASCTLLKAV